MLTAMLSLAASLGVATVAANAASPDSPRVGAPGAAAGRNASHALTAPATVGMSSLALIRAEEAVQSDLDRGAYPGAALAIGRYGRTVLEVGFGVTGRGWGSEQVDPDRTVYDLASLSKVVGTTTAVMLLYEDGLIRLDDPVSSYLPEFSGGGKERVTIRDLLAHTSGLPAGVDLPRDVPPEEALLRALRAPLVHTPGMRVEYSDIGFVVLYAAAERAAGEPLYRLLDRRVFGPLGMQSTAYAYGAGCQRCAGTSRSLGEGYRGRVHDPIARRLGGVAGNAGLFSTVHDLARFAAMMANGGELEGVRVLRPSTVRTFTMRQPGSGTRALGWDTPGRPDTGMTGRRASAGSFGHTGYTGTSLWIDPERGTWVVLLANRTYDSEENNRMQALRRTLHDRVAEATERTGMYDNLSGSGGR
jgi:CubicO group peptidase (beta-lactamase class C family)